MSDLQSNFESAAREVQQLPERPDNDTLLKLYSLYKQATIGNVKGKRPGFTDFVGRSKYDAWARLRNKSKEWAMEEYIKLVEELKA
jgi:acyl-CoA-binding protein